MQELGLMPVLRNQNLHMNQICMLSAREVREVMLQGTMFQKELTLNCRVTRALLRGSKKQEILRGRRTGVERWKGRLSTQRGKEEAGLYVW